jgi:aspartyl-tRNA(Asn)/glutamyl-tRNA(Gln) amidotransferase subunit C
MDAKEAQKIARLAQIELSGDQAQKLALEMSEILSHFKALSEIQTGGIEPLYSPVQEKTKMRADVVSKNFTAEEIMSNASVKTGNLYKIPLGG